MIYVKKYGGSVIKDKNDLMKISYNIVNSYISDAPNNPKYLIVVSAFKNETSRLKKLYSECMLKNDEENEAAFLVTGELQTAPLLAMMINNYGLKAKALNAYQISLITDNNYLDADIISLNQTKIDHYLLEYDILVISGYQGITENGEFTTLGFNGSDLTALYLSNLYRVPCHIYKDKSLLISNEDGSSNIPYLSYQQMNFLIEHGTSFLQEKLLKKAEEFGVDIILHSLVNDSQTTISKNPYLSSYPLNILGLTSYQIKIISQYTFSKPFQNLVKKIFQVDDFIYSNDSLMFNLSKNLLPLFEQKSLLLINHFQNTTIIIDNIIEYQIIYPDLQLLMVPKNNDSMLKDLLVMKKC